MKKPHLLAILIFIGMSNMMNAQDYFRGLIGYNYADVASDGSLQKTNKPLYIIYNRDYCNLSIDGTKYYFKVEGYSKVLENGDFKESFINAETESTKRGWFSILIQNAKAGSSTVTVNLPFMPGGHAYIIDDAKIYTSNGKINQKVHVENWKEIELMAKGIDSLSVRIKTRNIVLLEKKHLDDSLYHLDNMISAPSYEWYTNHRNDMANLRAAVYKNFKSNNNAEGYVSLIVDTSGYILACDMVDVYPKHDDLNDLIFSISDFLIRNKYKVPPIEYHYKDKSGNFICNKVLQNLDFKSKY